MIGPHVTVGSRCLGILREWKYFSLANPCRIADQSATFPLDQAFDSAASIRNFWKFSNDPHFCSIFETQYLRRLWGTIERPLRFISRENHYRNALPFVLAIAINNYPPALIDGGWNNGLRTGALASQDSGWRRPGTSPLIAAVKFAFRHYSILLQSLVRGAIWARQEGQLSLPVCRAICAGLWRFRGPSVFRLIRRRLSRTSNLAS